MGWAGGLRRLHCRQLRGRLRAHAHHHRWAVVLPARFASHFLPRFSLPFLRSDARVPSLLARSRLPSDMYRVWSDQAPSPALQAPEALLPSAVLASSVRDSQPD
eukprot:65808-Rhodomonas_salina.2